LVLCGAVESKYNFYCEFLFLAKRASARKVERKKIYVYADDETRLNDDTTTTTSSSSSRSSTGAKERKNERW